MWTTSCIHPRFSRSATVSLFHTEWVLNTDLKGSTSKGLCWKCNMKKITKAVWTASRRDSLKPGYSSQDLIKQQKEREELTETRIKGSITNWLLWPAKRTEEQRKWKYKAAQSKQEWSAIQSYTQSARHIRASPQSVGKYRLCLSQYLLCAFLSFSNFLVHAGQCRVGEADVSLPELRRSLLQGMDRAGSPACSWGLSSGCREHRDGVSHQPCIQGQLIQAVVSPSANTNTLHTAAQNLCREGLCTRLVPHLLFQSATV